MTVKIRGDPRDKGILDLRLDVETQQLTKSLRKNTTKMNLWRVAGRVLFEGMLVLHPKHVI